MDLPYKRPQSAPTMPDMLCTECNRELTLTEIGLHKKMINRGARRFMCVDCLAAYTGLSKEMLLEKAEYFRKMGCVLFR